MPSVLVPKRSVTPEWMDRADNSKHDLEGALADIHKVNRLLRGSKILIDALRPCLEKQREGETLTILDVGTGGGDLPIDIVLEARKMGKRVRITAVEKDATTAAYAKEQAGPYAEIDVQLADATRLPYPPESFDVVIASLFLHHFDAEHAAKLLREFRVLARRAVLINDLRRHLIPWAFIGIAAHVTGRHAMFRHDAPLSVLRGFTTTELRQAAREAGSPRATLVRRFPYRLLMTLPGSNATP
ncbi:MAG TPA: methyltransferase domain-containing protein [Candidatus Polarisedimenticolaceae bacterium]|nr:methyltransferase domain-containing protein [Candidatus Polarisedimenticolaceae bacterium]